VARRGIPVTALDGVAAAVKAGAAAGALDLEWGLIFAIDFNGAEWRARKRDGTGAVICALDPGDLALRMQATLEEGPW
jgi:hypothetical protein